MIPSAVAVADLSTIAVVVSDLNTIAISIVAAVASAINAVAGGGTLLSFPVLLFAGLPAVAANATSTVALLPGPIGGLFGFRRELAPHARELVTLLLPSLLGGGLGAFLLLATPDRTFVRIAPFLVLFATLLFLVQGRLARRREQGSDRDALDETSPMRRRRFGLGLLLQFVVSVYGGYFGAGIGILMLALLGFLGHRDLHAMNGLKNAANLAINGVAAAIFIVRGAVVWPVALVMIPCALLGGYLGARAARAVGRERARAAVIAIGFASAAALLFWR